MTNDEKVIILKEQVRLKKEGLEKSKKFVPITNCSIEIGNSRTRTNIQVLTEEELINLLIKINMYAKSAEELGYKETYKMSGYFPYEWMTDINARLSLLTVKRQETELRAVEQKLDALLSQDKKTELELDDIANMLK